MAIRTKTAKPAPGKIPAAKGAAKGAKGLSYGGGMHDADIERVRAGDEGMYHSDVGYRLEAAGWHRDDVINVTNRDSIAREIERLRKTGKSSREAASRLSSEMKKTFGAPATRRGYATGSSGHQKLLPSGWMLGWDKNRPHTVTLDDDRNGTWSDSAIYAGGRFRYDAPERIPEAVKKAVPGFYRAARRGAGAGGASGFSKGISSKGHAAGRAHQDETKHFSDRVNYNVVDDARVVRVIKHQGTT